MRTLLATILILPSIVIYANINVKMILRRRHHGHLKRTDPNVLRKLAPFSSDAQSILTDAVNEAKIRGHDIVGTEHLVLAIAKSSDGRAMKWISQTTYPELGESEGVEEMKNGLMSFLENRPIFQKQDIRQQLADVPKTDPEYSLALKRAIMYAQQIGSEPVHDENEGVTYEDGLVASEFLLAGVVVEGTGLGAEALTWSSKGKVNSYSLLQAINIKPETIIRPKSTNERWESFTVLPNSSDAEPERFSWMPPCSLIEISLPPSPTNNSNWLIPGKLIIGEHPRYPKPNDVITLIEAGVDTFVSLIGEYSLETFQSSNYPAAFSPKPTGLGLNVSRPVRFYHFPIRDFDVAEPSSVIVLVEELKRKLINGYTIFVHCRGGHG